jgi:hypothetical protein
VIRITISVAAYEAIASTLKPGSVAVEPEVDERGERVIWLEPAMVDRLGGCGGRARATATPFCGWSRRSRAAMNDLLCSPSGRRSPSVSAAPIAQAIAD